MTVSVQKKDYFVSLVFKFLFCIFQLKSRARPNGSVEDISSFVPFPSVLIILRDNVLYISSPSISISPLRERC